MFGGRRFVVGNIVGVTGPLDRDPQATTDATWAFRKWINHITAENVGAVF